MTKKLFIIYYNNSDSFVLQKLDTLIQEVESVGAVFFPENVDIESDLYYYTLEIDINDYDNSTLQATHTFKDLCEFSKGYVVEVICLNTLTISYPVIDFYQYSKSLPFKKFNLSLLDFEDFKFKTSIECDLVNNGNIIDFNFNLVLFKDHVNQTPVEPEYTVLEDK